MEPERQLLWKMGALRREKTVENRNGIKVPANWQYNSFWFADVDQIEAGKWNLLPENYRPEEQINLEIEDPVSSFAGDA